MRSKFASTRVEESREPGIEADDFGKGPYARPHEVNGGRPACVALVGRLGGPCGCWRRQNVNVRGNTGRTPHGSLAAGAPRRWLHCRQPRVVSSQILEKNCVPAG